jgi:hypothetical protein
MAVTWHLRKWHRPQTHFRGGTVLGTRSPHNWAFYLQILSGTGFPTPFLGHVSEFRSSFVLLILEELCHPLPRHHHNVYRPTRFPSSSLPLFPQCDRPSGHAFPNRWPSSAWRCITRPAAVFVNYVCTLKFSRQFRQLCTPRILIFPRAARE